MKKKRNIIIVVIIVIILIILTLWISGIIPKSIAKISATNYFKRNYPKIQMQYENIEWVASFGSYIIQFKDENNELHGFCIGPKYFPISLGQGIFGFEEDYRQNYDEKDKKNLEEQLEGDTITIKIKNGTLTKEGATIIITNKTSSQIGYGEWFRIDKRQNEEWVEAEIIDKNYIFNALGYIIREETNSEDTIDWSNLYGTLDNGRYQLVKEINGKCVAVEFTIDETINSTADN